MVVTVERQEVIQTIVARLVEGYAPEAIILFGSQAYGHPRPDSDIDLLLIKATSASSAERYREARACLEGEDGRHPYGPMDILVYTPDEINERLDIGDHFIEDILRQGEWLYRRSPADSPSLRAVREPGPPSYGSTPRARRYAQEWYEKAERDLKRVNILLSVNDAEGASFHLQQALEKFLKAFLIHHGWRLQRTHELVELLDEALKYDPALIHYMPLCKQVQKYYTDSRYPSKVPIREADVRAELTTAQAMIAMLRP